jgi:hypothetical protein
MIGLQETPGSLSRTLHTLSTSLISSRFSLASLFYRSTRTGAALQKSSHSQYSHLIQDRKEKIPILSFWMTLTHFHVGMTWWVGRTTFSDLYIHLSLTVDARLKSFAVKDVPQRSSGYWEILKVRREVWLAFLPSLLSDSFAPFLFAGIAFCNSLQNRCWNWFFTGVHNVDTNVETKTVVVEADESVSPNSMLEKLQKVRTFPYSGFCQTDPSEVFSGLTLFPCRNSQWGSASGKSVALAP